MEIFSVRLKWRRETRGLTQKEMGEKLGMTQSSYSKYEYGLREPNLSTLAKLPDILKESLDFLLGIVDVDNDIIDEYIELFEKEEKIREIQRRIQEAYEEIDLIGDETGRFARRVEVYNRQIKEVSEKGKELRDKVVSHLSTVPMVSEKTLSVINDVILDYH